MKALLIFILIICGGAASVFAQKQSDSTGKTVQPAIPAAPAPPAIPIEFLPGSDRFYFQAIISRDIPLTKGKLRFISVTNYATEYKNKNASGNDFVSVNIVSYKLGQHIGVGPSAANVAGLGWIPSLGFQLGWRKPSWALIFNPAISLTKQTNTNNVLVFEYFPRISKKTTDWRLYSRFQALYIHNFATGNHMRSSYFGRLGVSYKQFTLGAGVNYDYYNAVRLEKRNFGPFLRVAL